MHADAVLMTAAVTWAEQHPPESIEAAATWVTPGGDTGLTLAGEGAPSVAEFCIAEFALAIGRSTDGGRALVAAAVELKYRLPRVWGRVRSGGLEAWRARRIAEATMVLSKDAAAFVDAQVAPFAHRIGIAALERLIAEAIARFMPDRALAEAEKAADGRHFSIDHQQVSFGGTSQLTGELDLANALDLDIAVAKGARELLVLGSVDSLDARRSIAAGQIARNQLALDLTTETDAPAVSEGAGKGPKPRQVLLHVHLSDTAVTGTSTGNGSLELARVENQHRILTADQIRTWCANPDTEVIVKPVIDLDEHIHVEGYEVPDRLRDQTTERDHTCVFPWCTRSARKMDANHVIPYTAGGTTSSDNIAPLCRRHHRLKTHTAWTYTMLELGSFLWSSPHGYQFLRDHHGTLDISRHRPRPEASHRAWPRLIARSARCSTTTGWGPPSRARCSTRWFCRPRATARARRGRRGRRRRARGAPRGARCRGAARGRREHDGRGEPSLWARSQLPAVTHQRSPGISPGNGYSGIGVLEVVADALLVLEELGGDDGTDGVAAEILGAGVAAAVTEEPGQRVGPHGSSSPPSTLRSLTAPDRAPAHHARAAPSAAHR